MEVVMWFTKPCDQMTKSTICCKYLVISVEFGVAVIHRLHMEGEIYMPCTGVDSEDCRMPMD